MGKKTKLMSKEIDNLTQQYLNEFCEAYKIQKGVDFDRVELCFHEESNGKRAVFYFRVVKVPRPAQVDFN